MTRDIILALLPLVGAFLGGWVYGAHRYIFKMEKRSLVAHALMFHRVDEGELMSWASTMALMNYLCGSPLPDRLVYTSMEHNDLMTTIPTDEIIELERAKLDAG